MSNTKNTAYLTENKLNALVNKQKWNWIKANSSARAQCTDMKINKRYTCQLSGDQQMCECKLHQRSPRFSRLYHRWQWLTAYHWQTYTTHNSSNFKYNGRNSSLHMPDHCNWSSRWDTVCCIVETLALKKCLVAETNFEVVLVLALKTDRNGFWIQ